MKNRILSILTSIALAAGMTAESVSAEAELSTEAAALLMQIQYTDYSQYTPISADAGIKTASGMDAVTRQKHYSYAGIAFTCADPEKLTAAAPAEHPILESEGVFLGTNPTFFEKQTGENAEVFLLQTLTGYADAFLQLNAPGMGTAADILSGFADIGETVWLIASSTDNAEALVTWLYQQPDVQIFGATYGSSELDGWYDNIPPVIYAVPAAGHTLTNADFGVYSAKACPRQGNAFGYWYVELPVELTYDEAQAILEELEQNPAIAFCAHQPNFFTADMEQEIAGIELVPIRLAGSGDLNGDGEVNLTDANAALLYYNLAAVAMADEADYNLTPYEAKAADVNQDGIVDTKDANAIMLYYNYTVVSQVDGITWYDILKISGVPGAPE